RARGWVERQVRGIGAMLDSQDVGSGGCNSISGYLIRQPEIELEPEEVAPRELQLSTRERDCASSRLERIGAAQIRKDLPTRIRGAVKIEHIGTSWTSLI